MKTTTEIKSCRVQLGADAATGSFTAIVCTYNVIDGHGDTVRPGAFAKSIAAWRQSGNRLPVVYAHGNDLASIVGDVDPTTGLEDTPTGLIARGQLDLDDAEGAKVHRLLSRRTLREWSFRAAVTASTPANATAERGRLGNACRRVVTEMALVEIGPCLKGAGVTDTLEMKSAAVTAGAALPAALAARRVSLVALDRRVRAALVASGAALH